MTTTFQKCGDTLVVVDDTTCNDVDIWQLRRRYAEAQKWDASAADAVVARYGKDLNSVGVGEFNALYAGLGDIHRVGRQVGRQVGCGVDIDSIKWSICVPDEGDVDP